ncbi:hypothetical protein [Streptomyces sp. NPDC087437]|uniref:hypothetical protein n=1 Tax=Streptomyces sp. NPDC087437 TaxID=3365789 RepID=UPI0037F3FEC7
MALHLTGLSTEDIAEVINCLLLGAEQTAEEDGQLAAHRLSLAHRIGDALDELPTNALSREER